METIARQKRRFGRGARYDGYENKTRRKARSENACPKPNANMVAALIFVQEECARYADAETDGSAKELAAHLKGVVSEALAKNP